ncbi:acyl carrier protein [Sorangium sp. So ce302]|uniref:acyl carrier protein n=1 Tax=Sorangium sp. So ce302 TaxID=3133297 RepID=UPI003F644592
MVTASTTTQHVKEALIKVLVDVQQISGCKCPTLDESTRPIGDLEGFDSLRGLEVTVRIEAALGCSLGTENIFVSDSKKRAVRLKEVVDRIAKSLESQRAA